MTHELPKLSAPARRALTGAGLEKLDDLTRRTEAEILALHGMGPNAMNTLREAMREKELNFGSVLAGE